MVNIDVACRIRQHPGGGTKTTKETKVDVERARISPLSIVMSGLRATCFSSWHAEWAQSLLEESCREPAKTVADEFPIHLVSGRRTPIQYGWCFQSTPCKRLSHCMAVELC